eukprot:TRINITY_DN7167_c0_g1_i3.p1 TRINITY_DN7167_c0_g1~~TRINITY_DN7167_c0_g1_i3.p1  ORF type:complete len:417 (-),score=49.67 TRINITY_DN7167_c0_g1_i3:70-1320(-)
MTNDYIGSEEELLDKVRGSYDEEPMLFYFWSPHGLLGELELARISLPPDVEDKMYPAEILRKVYWHEFRTYSPSAAFLIDTFSYSTADQIEMLGKIEKLGMTPEEVACEWVQNNRVYWQNWIEEMENTPDFVPNDSAAGIIIVIWTACIQALAVVILALYLYKRKHPLLVATACHPSMLSLIGGIVMSAVSYWMIGEARVVNCAGATVMSGLGYVIMMGSLVLKEYRVFKLFLSDSKKLKMKPMKDTHLALHLALFLSIEISIIVLWLAVSPFDTTYLHCRPTDGTFYSLFIFFKGIILLACIYLGYKTRHIDFFAEGWNVTIASVVGSLVGIVAIILIFTLPVLGVVLTIGIGTPLFHLIFMCCIDIPKLWKAFHTTEAKAREQVSSSIISATASKSVSSLSVNKSGLSTGTSDK